MDNHKHYKKTLLRQIKLQFKPTLRLVFIQERHIIIEYDISLIILKGHLEYEYELSLTLMCKLCLKLSRKM